MRSTGIDSNRVAGRETKYAIASPDLDITLENVKELVDVSMLQQSVTSLSFRMYFHHPHHTRH